MIRKTKPLRNIFTSSRLIDLVCSFAPTLSINCGGIVDEHGRVCGGYYFFLGLSKNAAARKNKPKRMNGPPMMSMAIGLSAGRFTTMKK